MPLPIKATNEIWTQSAKWLQGSHLKELTMTITAMLVTMTVWFGLEFKGSGNTI